MRRASTIVGALALCAGLLAGCQSTPRSSGAMGVMNSKCPIMPDHAIDSTVSVDYKGGKVGFCCAGCIDEWNQLTDAQKAERLAKAK